MKRILLILILFCSIGTYVSAQQRISLGEGYTLVNGNGWSVLENDKRQMSVRIDVKQKSDSTYDVFCNNSYVKSATKGALKSAIKSAFAYANIDIPSWLSGSAVDYVYDSACSYFE